VRKRGGAGGDESHSPLKERQLMGGKRWGGVDLLAW